MKTNKKGFTLIELIIVSTIMVMIMGAILNFIQPMNNFYQRTLYNSDANDVGNILQDTFESEIRYATNICVLEGYEGVPAIVDGYLRDSTGGKALNSKYTDVIVIDNESLRGSVMAGFDINNPNDTVAHRKRARGQLLYAPLNQAGIDMEKLEIVGGEPLYSDMRCEFEGYLNIDDAKNNCLTLSSKLYKPEGNGTSYDFNKVIFNQKRDFELVNINLDTAASQRYTVDYFTTRVDTNDVTKYLAKTLDYAKFAKESTLSSSIPGINNMYNGVDENGNAISFTYIFYTKIPPNTDNVIVTINHEDGRKILEETLPTDSVVSDAKLEAWKNAASGSPYTDETTVGGITYRPTFSFFDAGNGKNFEEHKDTALTSDLELIARYTMEVVPTPNFHVTFYDRFDNSNAWIADANGKYNSNPYWSVPIYTPACSEGDDVLDDSEVKIPGGDNVHEFDHWEDSSGNVLVAGGRTIYGDEEYFAVYKDPAELTFIQDDGVEMGKVIIKHSSSYADLTSNSDYISNIANNSYVNAKQAAKKKIVWEVLDSSDNPVCNLDSMTEFPDNTYRIKARLEDMPEGLNITSFGVPTLNWGVAEYPITISNATSDNLYIKTMTVNFPSSFALDSYYCYDENYRNSNGTISAGASSVTITFPGNKWNAPMVPANGTLSVTLQLKRGNPNQIDPNNESASAYELSIGDVTVDETFTVTD